MNLENQLALSYYQEIAVLNEEHHISVVQHRETKKIYVKKLLTVYNGEVYRRLQQLNLEGVPRIREFLEGEGQAVLIEEYISGDTLQEKIDACRLTEKDIRRYTGELCRILNSLHQQAILCCLVYLWGLLWKRLMGRHFGLIGFAFCFVLWYWCL